MLAPVASHQRHVLPPKTSCAYSSAKYMHERMYQTSAALLLAHGCRQCSAMDWQIAPGCISSYSVLVPACSYLSRALVGMRMASPEACVAKPSRKRKRSRPTRRANCILSPASAHEQQGNPIAATCTAWHNLQQGTRYTGLPQSVEQGSLARCHNEPCYQLVNPSSLASHFV